MESREDKSLSQNHVFTFKISSFTTSIFLLIILCFLIEINDVLNKIGAHNLKNRSFYSGGLYEPLWAHVGPFGPGPGSRRRRHRFGNLSLRKIAPPKFPVESLVLLSMQVFELCKAFFGKIRVKWCRSVHILALDFGLVFEFLSVLRGISEL